MKAFVRTVLYIYSLRPLYFISTVNMSISFESICRLCMMDTNAMIQFDENVCLPKKIMMLIPSLKIVEGDNLPRQVCEDCFNQINDFDTFKSKCEYSEDRMKKYLKTIQLENGDTKGSETWRSSCEEIIPGISNPWEKVDAKTTEVEINCKKEDADEDKYFEVKVEARAEEYNCDVIKSEPEIEIRTSDETRTTKNVLVKTVSNSNKTRKSSQPDNVICNVCGKMVVRWRLAIHTKRHSVGRPYKCKDCGKVYIDQSSLKVHSVIHSGIKAHMCDICGKRFKLLTHLKNHHLTHTGQKSYVCEVCGKRFSQIGNLKKHEFIHTGEKPFNCDICGKCFSEKNSLQIHLAVHTGQKQYVCDICGKRFINKGNLNNHLVVHTGEKRFSCDICGNRYAQRHSLKKHKAKYHIHK